MRTEEAGAAQEPSSDEITFQLLQRLHGNTNPSDKTTGPQRHAGWDQFQHVDTRSDLIHENGSFSGSYMHTDEKQRKQTEGRSQRDTALTFRDTVTVQQTGVRLSVNL